MATPKRPAGLPDLNAQTAPVWIGRSIGDLHAYLEATDGFDPSDKALLARVNTLACLLVVLSDATRARVYLAALPAHVRRMVIAVSRALETCKRRVA